MPLVRLDDHGMRVGASALGGVEHGDADAVLTLLSG